MSGSFRTRLNNRYQPFDHRRGGFRLSRSDGGGGTSGRSLRLDVGGRQRPARGADNAQMLPPRSHERGSVVWRRKRAEREVPANHGAERAGFEPAMGVEPHTRLAGECLQPLGHLSRKLLEGV